MLRDCVVAALAVTMAVVCTAVPLTETGAQSLTPQAPDNALVLSASEPAVKPETKDMYPPAPKKELVEQAAVSTTEEYPDIVVAIPTMRRWTHDKEPAPEHYLRNLVMGIISSMTPAQRSHVSFLLLNVDKEPHKHEELMQLADMKLDNVTVMTKQPKEHVNLAQYLPTNEDGMYEDAQGRHVTAETVNWRAGETMDAPRLWLSAYRRADYVLFLEDDVTPTSNVMSKLFAFISEAKRRGKDDFLFVDLYTPAISWGPSSATNMEVYPYECCTQAMLFNSKRIPEISAYEFDHPDSPVDDNLRDFVRQSPNDRKVLAMMPNPFQHVGRFSSSWEKSTGTVEHTSLEFVP